MTKRQILFIIEIEKVRTVVINQLLATVEPGLGKLRVHLRDTLRPNTVVCLMPLRHRIQAGETVRNNDVVTAIELLRVITFPPFPLAVLLGQIVGIVADAGLIAGSIISVCRLEPVPGVRRVVAHAKAKSVGACCLGKVAHDVTPGSHIHRVPWLVLRVVVVEVVVMVGHTYEVSCANAFVQAYQLLRVELLCLPHRNEILHAKL